MEESIRNFAEQFTFEPKIENGKNLKSTESFAIGGMGGSALGAGILKSIDPELNIRIHRDYGLPFVDDNAKKKTLFIASSFSGNTEETIDFLEAATANNLNVAVVTKGGELLKIVKERGLPYIQLPELKIQPRMALGYSLLALAKLIKPDLVPALNELARTLHPLEWQDSGKELAQSMINRIPVVYASRQNRELARIWKIKFNETAKTPAFFNIFPELNHNEMTSFDYTFANEELSKKFFFIFLRDREDYPKNQRRMNVCEKIFKEKGLAQKSVFIEGENKLQKIFNSLILGDWASLFTAKIYGAEPDQVPMVEKFKSLMK